MQSIAAAAETTIVKSQHVPSTIAWVAAVACLGWSVAVAVVCTVGYVQIRRYYSNPPPPPRLAQEPDVTIIRPIKGVEPCLYECLASTFQQSYSRARLHVRFCISSRSDPSLPILEQLLRDFPDFDAQILVEEEDNVLQHGSLTLGPNPKIRNMSRAYREAQGNAIWIIDCNVWVGRDACARMIDKLQDNKFVHLLPLVVDITVVEPRTPWRLLGGRLEEMFLSSSHAKFYTAINTVLLAPCIVGKSTMFRKSHLDSLTDGQGIDYFSYNICEDHLIGDLLWKRQVPEERGELGKKMGKHAMCFGDLAIQPVSGMSVSEYWSRRVRWLRVRKFTVLIATLVEPGTESVLCSLYLAFAVTTLPFFHDNLAIPQSWTAFTGVWLVSEIVWCTMDWTLHKLLHSGASVHFDENTPSFVQTPASRKRTFLQWLLAWLGREFLAFPIWSWAFYGGTTVEWRGKKLWVGLDMKVHEISDSASGSETTPLRADIVNGHWNGHEERKARRD